MDLRYFAIFLTSVSLGFSLRQNFRNSLQVRVDALEERYDRDYVFLKDEIRDLWEAFGYLNTNCCVEQTVPSAKSLPPITSSSGLNASLSKPKMDHIYHALRKAFAEEKSYMRDGFNKVVDAVNDMKEQCKDDLMQVKQRLERFKTRMDDLEKQTEEMKEYQETLKSSLKKDILMTENNLVHLNEAWKKLEKEASLHRPGSCEELVRNGITTSGVYTLYDELQSFTVFCLMRDGGGYTFVYPNTLLTVNIKTLSNDFSHVLIRHRRTDGRQYETRIEQILRYANRPISVQYNSHVGYKGIVNSKMTPYVYVGLTPLTLENGRQHRGDTQGYRANGKDITFINCDGNPNGYFAFLFNHNGESPSSSYSPALARQWVDTAVPVPDVAIPDKFLSFFELHFGGCGVFASTDRISGVTGAAVGIPFKL